MNKLKPFLLRWSFLALSALSFIALAIAVALITIYKKEQWDQHAASKEKLVKLTKNAADEINTVLRDAALSADALASKFSENGGLIKLPQEKKMQQELKETLQKNPYFFGGSVTFKPGAYPIKNRCNKGDEHNGLDAKEEQLYSAYYSRIEGGNNFEYSQLECIYDYTQEKYSWYGVVMTEGNRWSEPYWDDAGKTYMTTYSARFNVTDKKSGTTTRQGVVTIDIAMSGLRSIVENLDLGPSGFGALTTEKGTYLYHPRYRYVRDETSLLEVAGAESDPDRRKVAKLAANREGGVISHISTTTGQDSWLIVAPVLISGWSLQNTYIKKDIKTDIDKNRHWLAWTMLATMAFFLTATAAALRIEQSTQRKVWLLSHATALIFMFGIAFMWHLALEYQNPINGHTAHQDNCVKNTCGECTKDNCTKDNCTENNCTKHNCTNNNCADQSRYVSGEKLSKVMLTTIKDEYTRRVTAKGLPKPIYIPTGVHIDSIDFKGANDISISGIIWQKYDSDYPDKLKKGLQISRSKGAKFEQYDCDPANTTDPLVLRCRFQADVRIRLNYSRYPLQVEQIGIEFVPLESNPTVQLVPDFDAYTLTTAALKPGLDKSVFIPGWDIMESMFTFRDYHDAESSLGVKRNFDQDQFYKLNFEIGLKRIFRDAFISNLTPLIVVLIALFALTLLAGRVEVDRVLNICVAVFFVVVFSHLDIRQNFGSGEIFYLEYFFFLVYLVIILVPFNAMRLKLDKKIALLDSYKGIALKAAYWPSIMIMLFIVTLIKFY